MKGGINDMMKQMYMTNPLEIFLLVLVIFYLFSTAPTPRFIAAAMDTPLGIVVLFMVIVFLFMYSHILLAILFVLVAYKLLGASSSSGTAVIEYTPVNKALASTGGQEMGGEGIILPNQSPDKNGDVRFQHHGYADIAANKGGKAGTQKVIPLETDGNLEINVVKSMVETKSAPHDYLETPFKPVSERVHGASQVM